MMDAIYHNPKCSKSRQTLALLEEHDVDIEIIEYLKHPPSKDQLDSICTALKRDPFALIRTADALFDELGLTREDERTRDEWLTLMVQNPALIERPIVTLGDRAAVGRPPENVLALLRD